MGGVGVEDVADRTRGALSFIRTKSIILSTLDASSIYVTADAVGDCADEQTFRSIRT
jgi:hypothetical protein